MDATIAGDLGVERGREDRALPHGHDVVGGGAFRHPGQDVHTGPDPLDPRRADEHRADRIAVDAGEVEVGLERVHLTSEGVAPHRHVEPVEVLRIGAGVEHLAREQDHPGTRAVGRHPVLEAGTNRIEEIEDGQQPAHRRRLAARNHQAVHGFEFGESANAERTGAAGFERREMLADVALECEHADGRLFGHERMSCTIRRY